MFWQKLDCGRLSPIIQHAISKSPQYFTQSSNGHKQITIRWDALVTSRISSRRFQSLNQRVVVMEDQKSSHPHPRRFAALHPYKAAAVEELGLPRLEGIVFDVDGTLCWFPIYCSIPMFSTFIIRIN